MQVDITRYEPHPSGIRLRLVIRSERTGWVQFASTVIPFDDLDDYLRDFIVRRISAYLTVQEADEPLF